ncbi:MAG TPA: 3-hydroxybutyryl-CoA dehydratase [Porticoccaceae bacterium]|nr:3-hydroxybutyryl-CoA dehydratase [Porticoccaceae bacterium]
MAKKFPTVDQVRELEQLAVYRIPPAWQDMNGHVNIQYYQTLYEIGGWPLFERMGIDLDYFKHRRLGIFDLEHHIAYLKELHVGETVSIHGRFIARNQKRIHGMIFIVNADQNELACTIEFISASTSLTTRRTNEFPDDILTALDALITAEEGIDWPSPVCGAMSV